MKLILHAYMGPDEGDHLCSAYS